MLCQHNCESKNINQLCISKVPIFNHLSPDEMKQILKLSNRQSYEKDQLIFDPLQHADQLYIIHTGRVKIYRLTETGKEQLLRILEPGDFMGELTLFANIENESYAEAIENTEICLIHRQDLHRFIKKHPTIALKILEQFSERLNGVETTVQSLNSSVEERIINYLSQLLKEKPLDQEAKEKTVSLPMSKKDFASFIGTTQETLSRNLTNLQNKNFIKQSGQRDITILKLDKFIQNY